MTAPGDGFGEHTHDEQANPPSADSSGAPDQPETQWQPPASAPEYPSPAYPPLGYPSEYHPGYAAQNPPPPPQYGQAPEYEEPPVQGAPTYQSGPSQFGGPPAGYGPPSYPGGYYPAPDYLGGYGLPSGVKPGTNKLAIASLVSSFTGVFCCCIGSVVAIVLGAVAINQIKRTQQDGYGLAVAGIVIGVAALVVSFIFVVFALHSR